MLGISCVLPDDWIKSELPDSSRFNTAKAPAMQHHLDWEYGLVEQLARAKHPRISADQFLGNDIGECANALSPAKSQMGSDRLPGEALQVHVGSRLLGFLEV